MSDLAPDQRVAERLGMHIEHVGRARNQFNESADGAIVRAIIADRLAQFSSEATNKLRKTDVAGLSRLQGALDAYDLCIATVLHPIQ